MKLAIGIATYYKKDGSTAFHLTRALNSIKNQSYQDYMVYLIGDHYENEQELFEIAKIIDKSKIKVTNLPFAAERSKYRGKQLWVCGGANAYNNAISNSIADGLNYFCHLDHDDYWLENHLETIINAINSTHSNFICTLTQTPQKTFLPNDTLLNYLNKWRPLPSKLIHSSTCINFSYFNMKYRNMIEENNSIYPSDADLWSRINKFLEEKNEYGILVNKHTVVKDCGQEVIKKTI